MKTEMLANFVRRAPEVLAEVEKERMPILLAQENGPAAYLVDMATFEDLKLRLWILEGGADREEPLQPMTK
jgi:PHD/YefM family antitoxin component YafN of YafNO toxin-antitoxin module